jgi:hypothetical protein
MWHALPVAKSLPTIWVWFPIEHSSGIKRRLGAITRRGNCFLRKLLVEAAQKTCGTSLLTCSSRSCLFQSPVMVVYTSDPDGRHAPGLTEKLYWRRAKGVWHCFKKLARVHGFVSLCQSARQQFARPEADCAAVCAMDWKLRSGGGMAQAWRRHGVRAEAPVDEARASSQ